MPDLSQAGERLIGSLLLLDHIMSMLGQRTDCMLILAATNMFSAVSACLVLALQPVWFLHFLHVWLWHVDVGCVQSLQWPAIHYSTYLACP